jgi:DNA-binding NtrC family response regulator
MEDRMLATVLIVDDEPGMRELLKRWLAGEKYDALEARDAEEAVKVLAQTPDVKVVIADLQMPGKGGAWLVDQIQQRFPTTAVVLATADDQVPGTLSLQPSVVGYLVKPLTIDGVRRNVREGVRRSHEFAERARVRSATDPIETFLDRKLTGGKDDDGN